MRESEHTRVGGTVEGQPPPPISINTSHLSAQYHSLLMELYIKSIQGGWTNLEINAGIAVLAIPFI